MDKDRGIESQDVNRAAGQAKEHGEKAAHEVSQSPFYQALVKVGLIAYGVVHLLIAWIAVQLATGGKDGGEDASNQGALAVLAEAPFGRVLLWAIAAGFAMLVVWQLVLLLIGHREFEGMKRWRKRGSSLMRVIIFGYLAVASTRIALKGGAGQSEGGESQRSLSGRLMEMPGGQLLVGLVGAIIVGYGIYQIVKGIRGKFNDDLEKDLTGTGRWVAAAGFIAKGIAYAMVGSLFITAAWQFDPEQAGGLDKGLSRLASQPFGEVMLIIVGVGVAMYGLYCFYWAMNAKKA